MPTCGMPRSPVRNAGGRRPSRRAGGPCCAAADCGTALRAGATASAGFLTRDARAAAADAVRRRSTALVRERDGYRADAPRLLPDAAVGAADDPQAAEWRIRRESYAHLQRHALAGGLARPDARPRSRRRLRLAVAPARGARPPRRRRRSPGRRGRWAGRVPPLPGAVSGGAGRLRRAAVRAARSSTSSCSTARCTTRPIRRRRSREARRMLAPGGALAVMDSPMFRRDARRRRRWSTTSSAASRPSTGSPTPIRAGRRVPDVRAARARVAERSGFAAGSSRSRGPLAWRLRRAARARRRLGARRRRSASGWPDDRPLQPAVDDAREAAAAAVAAVAGRGARGTRAVDARRRQRRRAIRRGDHRGVCDPTPGRRPGAARRHRDARAAADAGGRRLPRGARARCRDVPIVWGGYFPTQHADTVLALAVRRLRRSARRASGRSSQLLDALASGRRRSTAVAGLSWKDADGRDRPQPAGPDDAARRSAGSAVRPRRHGALPPSDLPRHAGRSRTTRRSAVRSRAASARSSR